MPRIGLPAAARSRSAASRPRSRRPAIAERRRADARQHREVGVAHGVGVVGDLRVAPRRANASSTERTLPAPYAQIATVHSRPFVDGSSAPSRRTASRSARPTALHAASATWCGSRPVALDVQRHARRLREALERVAREARDPPARSISAPRRPPRSTAARASASSIGTTAEP